MATRNRSKGRSDPAIAVDRGDVYMGAAAHGDVLSAELLHLGAKRPYEVAPGLVVVEVGALVDPCFARTVLPRARAVTGATANNLAGAVVDAAEEALGALPDASVVVLPDVARRGSRALDEHPLTAAREQLAAIVDAKIAGRRAKRGDVAGAAAPAAAPAAVVSVAGVAGVVSVVVVDAWRAWVSTHAAQQGPALLTWPSAFPAGRAL